MMALSAEQVLQQEYGLELDSFSAEDAVTFGMKVLEISGERSKYIVVAVRRNGKLLFYKAGADTVIAQDELIRRKTNAVNRQGHSSLYLFLKYDGDEQAFCQVYDVSPEDCALHGGCFPIKLRNTKVVGTVAVTGLTAEENHLLCLQALSFIKRRQSEGEIPVL
ncbi:uncharacterized protein (UPF0303 family) [Paenibacillus forsythiae]|uniref:Uncharacterized protein (UPF0303 family) n=2 Tax=Paenibacillus forsythiae TaxID=365616 RepID=A0ABU3HAK4_9BACL|nr:heme-binding protein [Paenibacillus forsythiae]MDT3427844.1 uncharacterized protein (UPF0303 family) [Paenibacillus forsythiae]